MQEVKSNENFKLAIYQYIQELSIIVKKRCSELDEYQQVIVSEDEFEFFPFSHESPYSPFEFDERGILFDKNKVEQDEVSSSSRYQGFDIDNRTELNENSYKAIFFIMNRILNNDSTYDKYIQSFRTSLLSELNLYIVNNYFEIVKKELEKIIKYTSVNPQKIMQPLNIFEEIDKLCDKFGIEYVMAANEAIRGLLNEKDIKIVDSNTYNKSSEQLINGDFRVETGNSYPLYETKMPGIGRTIYEIKNYLKEKAEAMEINLARISSFYSKIRNVGSHGEFEYSIDKMRLKNNQNVVSSPSGKEYFTMEELNNISENIIDKISKIEGISPNLFSPMIKPLFKILSGTNVSVELDKVSTEYEKFEMINLLTFLSLFSIVQLNSENLFKYLSDTQNQTLMEQIKTSLPIKKTIINPTTKQKEETDTILGQGMDKSQIWTDFENIKNAVGHNNVYISFFNIICTNDYVTFKRKTNNLSEVFLNSDDYTKRGAYVQIVFQIIDWIKYISNDDFFKMISMSAIEQSEYINRFKK